jgi:hypothetical protein
MNYLNLVLKFQLAGKEQDEIRGISRISIDGGGSVTFYDVQNECTEVLDLGQVRSLSLLSLDQFIGQAAQPVASHPR